MNPVISAQLKDFKTTHSEERLSSSEFFEVFSIHSIKFYALFAAVRDSWDGGNLLNEHVNQQRTVVNEVTKLLDDEEKWVQHIEGVSAVLDKRISKQGLKTREQIRDYIRTDGAVLAFKEDAYS